jgi:hypothetical protein
MFTQGKSRFTKYDLYFAKIRAITAGDWRSQNPVVQAPDTSRGITTTAANVLCPLGLKF